MIVHLLGEEERVAFLSLVVLGLLGFWYSRRCRQLKLLLLLLNVNPQPDRVGSFFFQPSPSPAQALDSFCHVSRITTATPQL